MSVKNVDSFGILKIANGSHLHWQQVLSGSNKTIDSVWMEQHFHGPFDAEAASCEDELYKNVCTCPTVRKQEMVIIITAVTIVTIVFVTAVICCVCVRRRRCCRKKDTVIVTAQSIDGHSLLSADNECMDDEDQL